MTPEQIQELKNLIDELQSQGMAPELIQQEVDKLKEEFSSAKKIEPVAETTAPAAGRIDPTSTLSTGSQLEDGSLESQKDEDRSGFFGSLAIAPAQIPAQLQKQTINLRNAILANIAGFIGVNTDLSLKERKDLVNEYFSRDDDAIIGFPGLGVIQSAKTSEEAEAVLKDIDAKQLKPKEQSILESFQAGNFKDAAFQTADGIIQALPSIAFAATGPAGIAIHSALIAGEKWEDELNKNPDIDAGVLAANALGTGVIQGASDILTRGLLKTTGVIAKEGSAKAAKEFLKDGLGQALKKFGLLSLGEGGTEVLQNITNKAYDKLTLGTEIPSLSEMKYELFDEFLIGSLMGGGVSLASSNKKANIAKRNYTENLLMPEDIKVEIDNTIELYNDIARKRAAETNPEARALFEEQLKSLENNAAELKRKYRTAIYSLDNNQTDTYVKNKDQVFKTQLELEKATTEEGKNILQKKINSLEEDNNRILQEGVNKKFIETTKKAQKEAKKLGVETKIFETSEQLQEYIDNNPNAEVLASQADGFIIRDGDKKEILINKEVAEKTGAVNVASHELLHAVLYRTLKGSPQTAINLGDALAKELSKIDINKVNDSSLKNRLELYKNDPENIQSEELITLFSDAIATGDIKFEENIFTKIGDKTRRVLQNIGYKDIEFNTGRDVYNFIKDYNKSIEKGDLKAIEKKAKEGIKGKLIAKPSQQNKAAEIKKSVTKPLTIDQINEQVKTIEKGKMPQELAAQIAYAYEPLANSIAEKIYRTYPEFKEQGYTKGDFAMDIAFGDPKEIGGVNSIVEIAKEYDPKKDKSLGGWLKDIANQRAKRIADVRIGRQKTTGAQTLDAPAVDQTVDEITPEIKETKAIVEKLNIAAETVDKAKNAVDNAILNAINKLKGTESLTATKRLAIRNKAFNDILDGRLYRDIQKEFGRNTSTSKAFTDYLNKNFETLREAAIKNIDFQKGVGASLNWNTKAPTKQEFIDYYIAEGEKKSTRSDRKRKLAKAVGIEIANQAREEYVKNNPIESEQFKKQTGIVLASKSFVDEFVKKNNITKNYNLSINQDIKSFDKNFSEYEADVRKLVKLFNVPGLLNKSLFMGPFGARPKGEGSIQRKNWDTASNAIASIEYGKDLETKIDGRKVFSKVKAEQYFKGKEMFGSKTDELLTGKLIKKVFNRGPIAIETLRIYNKANAEQGRIFWEKANEIFQNGQNRDLLTAFATTVSSTDKERNHPHTVMAEVSFVEKNLKDTDKVMFEHAVPSSYAAKKLLDAMFNDTKSFLKRFEKIKSQYKQGILKEATDNIISKDDKYTMPDVDGRPFDIDKDSYIVRYTTAIPNIKDQLQWIGEGSNDFDVKTPKEQIQASKSLSTDFNRILEEVKGVPTRERFSEARANILGKKKNPFKFFVPYSAEDYMGLIYPTLGKGKIGDKNLEWYKKNIIDPYAKGIRDFESDKQFALKSWEDLKAQIKNTPAKLNKEATNDFTNENAIRIYLWAKQGVDFNNIGLNKKEVAAINRYVKSKPELKNFATQIQSLTPDGYPEPTGTDWLAGTITTDLVNYTNTVSRAKYLKEWQDNVDIVYSKENMNKLKAIYGENYTDALQDMLYRMKTGRNRPSGGNKLTNQYLNWVNDSVGTIMFFNMRSAMLQTISSVNYLNWTDNNPINVAKTAANQKQFWSDFAEIFNSDFLKSRRSGLKTDVNADEIARSAETSKNKFRAGLSALLKKGFLPTQYADSFAISFGGASFYRNRINTYLKQGLDEKAAKEKAFLDFKEITEESQQSSRPDRVSMQQASPLGRVILAFANTPMQYTRLTKKAALDLINRRGDWKTNLSKLMYYGAVQNIIFTALQSAMFAMLFSDDDDDKEKERYGRIGNGIADTLLRGSGVAGAAVATAKNMVLKVIDEYRSGRPNYEKVAAEITTLSPPINSKLRKLQSAGRAFTYKQNLEKMREEGPLSLDNPAYMAAAQVLSATANIPLDRALRKLENLRASVDSNTEMWQRISLMLGYSKWDVGIIDEERKQKKIDNQLRRIFERQSKIRKNKKRKDPASTLGGSTRRNSKSRDKASTLNKGLPQGVLGRANNDGTIEIKPGLSKAKEKKVIAHEKQHMRDMKSGKLNYDDNFVYWNSSKYKRTDDNKIVYNGKKFPEGHSKLPWEAVANKAERKVS